MPTSFYEIVWIFLIYAFIGWCAEVAFAAVNEGVFVNRGFLNGPYCPIYGAGVLTVVALLEPLKENAILLFAGSLLLTSILEYLTGFVLEKVFGNKWWDYSDMPFNIRGYVCLKFSIMWGLGCMFIVHEVHPHIMHLIRWVPQKVGITLAVLLVAAFAADLLVTVNTILNFNKKLRMLEEIAAGMHKVSDEIGEDIFERVSDIQKDVSGARSRVEELNAEYRKLMAHRPFGVRRLMRAFPRLKSRDHDKILQQYKDFLKKKQQKEKDENVC